MQAQQVMHRLGVLLLQQQQGMGLPRFLLLDRGRLLLLLGVLLCSSKQQLRAQLVQEPPLQPRRQQQQ